MVMVMVVVVVMMVTVITPTPFSLQKPESDAGKFQDQSQRWHRADN